MGISLWVVATPSGTAFAWHQVQGLMPGSIQIGAVKGRLLGPLTLKNVHIDNKSSDLSVDKIALHWDPAALLHDTVHVNKLAVDGVHYIAKPNPTKPPQNTAPIQLPSSIKLPASLQIDTVTVDNVAYRGMPNAKPFRVTQAQVKNIRLHANKWHIGQLSGQGPMFQLQARGDVTPNTGYPTKLEAKATLKTGSLAPISAKVTAQGKLDNLSLSANVTSPYNIKLNGHVKNALVQPKLELHVALDHLKAHAISSSLPPLTASANVDLKGPIDNLAINLDAAANSSIYGKATAKGQIHYTPSAVSIKQLTLTSPQTAGRASVEGQLALTQQKTMNLMLSWSKFQWPLKGKPQYRTSRGQVHLSGPLTDYQLTGAMDWQVVGHTAGHMKLAGHGSQSAFTVSKLAITDGPGQINGQAKARWAPSLQASASLTGHDIRPGTLVKGVSGDLNFNLAASAETKKSEGEQSLKADLKTLTAHGQLNGHPIKLNAQAEYGGQRIVVNHLQFDSGSAHASMHGRLGLTADAALKGQLNIKAPKLADFWPSLAGQLDANANLGGTLQKPVVKATLNAHNLRYGNYKVARADLNANVDWSGHHQSRFNVNVANVEADGRHVNNLSINAKGTPASHDINLAFNGAGAELKMAFTGHYQTTKKTEKFRLTKLNAKYGGFAPWHLAGTANGVVSDSSQNLNKVCLVSGQARMCVNGSHSKKNGSQADIKLANIGFDYIKPILPSKVSVSGALSGQIHARQPASGHPNVDVRLITTSGHVKVNKPDGKSVNVLTLQPGTIDASLHDRQLLTKVDLPFQQGGIHAHVAVAGGKAGLLNRPLSGQLRFDLSKLGVINKFSPQVGDINGQLHGNLKLSGQIAKPAIHGRLDLNAPKVVLIKPGLTLKDMTLSAVGQGNHINLNGQVKSGGGTLNLAGEVGMDKTGQSAHMTVKGKNFEAVNMPQVKAFISPDLRLAITPKKIDVNGTVTVPKANITPKDLPESGATTVSSDQVIVGQKHSAAKTVARVVHADLHLILGQKIHINGFGLKTDATGHLHIVQQPGQPASGSGRIELKNGSYRAYGQNLKITKGQILFGGGPLTKPALNVEAARYPNNNITVGVHVRGPVAHPNVALFSTPPMTQTEQLSWLLLGRGPNSSSGGASNMIAKAALALGSGRANSVLHKLGNELGVDHIGVGTSAGQSSSKTAFTLGKYLTPKLYLSYGIGLFNQVSTVSLKYMLTSHWTLQTESSSVSTGGDIIFSINQ